MWPNSERYGLRGSFAKFTQKSRVSTNPDRDRERPSRRPNLSAAK